MSISINIEELELCKNNRYKYLLLFILWPGSMSIPRTRDLHRLVGNMFARSYLERRFSMMLVVQYQEGTERPAGPDRRGHFHHGLILADQPMVAFFWFRQLQVRCV